MKSLILCVMLSGVGLLCQRGALAADAVPQVQNDLPYMTGGIGSDETQAMQDARKNYNLLMTFAIKSGEYQADVDVTLVDHGGKALATFKAVGPLFYVKVVPGQYRIQATARGKQLSQSAAVTAGATRDVRFYWDAQ